MNYGQLPMGAAPYYMPTQPQFAPQQAGFAPQQVAFAPQQGFRPQQATFVPQGYPQQAAYPQVGRQYVAYAQQQYPQPSIAPIAQPYYAPQQQIPSPSSSSSQPFIATPNSNDLGAGNGLLGEAFAVIAYRFAALDEDKAQVFSYKMIEYQLSLKGFKDYDKLQQVFKKVDENSDSSIDFAEFLGMIYLWSIESPPTIFFKHPQNADVVRQAVLRMEQIWTKYDEDLSRSISWPELTTLLSSEFPRWWSTCQPVIDSHYPQQSRESGAEMGFPHFMHLLYACLCRQPRNRIPQDYITPVSVMGKGRVMFDMSAASGRGSWHWQLFENALAQLENDFARVDKQKNDYLDITEITTALHFRPGAERLAIHRRLQHKFEKEQVDRNESGTLDFFEFTVMAYLMCLDGNYVDLMGPTSGSHVIKSAFVKLSTILAELGHQNKEPHDMLITMGDACKFFRKAFDFEPTEIDKVFKQVGGSTLTLEKLMRLIYWIIRPQPAGKYPPGFYEAKARPEAKVTEIEAGGENVATPSRIDPVMPQLIRKTKKLGEGGQGSVWLGTYSGQPVAVKNMKGNLTKEIMDDLSNEVTLLMKLTHPNCHFLLGAKLSVDALGGPILLTEVCPEGSIFDLYQEKRCVFTEATAWRLSMECAQGLNALHELGYMHRDIKSLNVFLAKGYTAKVADFGMATDAKSDTAPMGTVLWMAPEVMTNFMQPGTSAYDKRCDIFSYAVLVYEIYNCKVPYSELAINDQSHLIMAILQQQIRPNVWRPNTVNRDVRNFIMRCWAQNPNHRPQTFGEVIQLLQEIRPAGFEM